MIAENQIVRTIIRDAEKEDYVQIKELLRSLELPVQGVKENIHNFLILIQGTEIIATVGLEIYGNAALLRSLGVKHTYQSKGYGRRLYDEIIKKAEMKNISEIYLLTETAEKYFSSLSFTVVSRDNVEKNVKTSVEFRSVCPESAICMRLLLT